MRYVHHKRGTQYDVIGIAELQGMYAQYEGASLVVYRGDDGKLWARSYKEFHDGRFGPEREEVNRITDRVRGIIWGAINDAQHGDLPTSKRDAVFAAAREIGKLYDNACYDVIYNTLHDFNLTNMSDQLGTDGFPLVDLVSNDGCGIDTGEEQLRLLATDITDNLSAALTPDRNEKVR